VLQMLMKKRQEKAGLTRLQLSTHSDIELAPFHPTLFLPFLCDVFEFKFALGFLLFYALMMVAV